MAIDPTTTKVSELGLLSRTKHCLHNRGIRTVADLLRFNSDQLRSIIGFGRKSVEDVQRALACHSLALREDDPVAPEALEISLHKAVARMRAAKEAYARASAELQQLVKTIEQLPDIE